MVVIDPIQEAALLEEFRVVVQDLSPDECTLRRFLRARNHDIKKSEDMLRKSMEWRKETDIDSCFTWNLPASFKEEFPYNFPGRDNEGRTVLYMPVGRWEVRKMIEKGYKEEMIRNIYFVLEDIMAHIKETKHEQFVHIIDLAGLTYWKVAHYETMQMTLKVFRNFEASYPERLKEAIVINAPWVFGYVWPFIKPLLSGNTLSKVKVYDSNPAKWQSALLERMPEETLPTVA